MFLEHVLNLVRPKNGILLAAGFLVSYLISTSVDVFFKGVIGALVVFFIVSAGIVLNDLRDMELDLIKKPERPLPRGVFSKKKAEALSAVLFSLGTGLSIFISLEALVFVAVVAVITIIYNGFLKDRSILVDNVVFGLLVSSAFLFGGVVASPNNLGISGIMAVFVFIFISAFDITQDIAKKFKEEERITVRNVFGKRYASIFVAALLGFFVVLSIVPYHLGLMDKYYMVVMGVADALFLYAAVKLINDSSVLEVIRIQKLGVFLSVVSFFSVLA